MAIVERESDAGKNTIRYLYDIPDDPNDAITFNGILMYQDGAEVCLSKCKGEHIIRLTTVASMEFLRSPSQTYTQAMDLTMEKYQRPVDPERRDTISAWFADPDNFIVNSIVIWLPDMGDSINALMQGQAGITIVDYDLAGNNRMQADERRRLPESISTKTFQIPTIDSNSPNATERHIRLSQTCSNNLAAQNQPANICGSVHMQNGAPTGYWFDVCPNPDCDWTGRPGHLIDGQHRARGVADSASPLEILSTNIIDEATFDADARSKIFEEVTNTATQLADLHRLNLAYRRRGQIRLAGQTFDMTAGSPNSRSYEVLASLTQGNNPPGAVLQNRIHVLPPQPNRNAYPGRMMNITDGVIWSSIAGNNMNENWWAGPNGPWVNPATGAPLTVAQASRSLQFFYEALSGVAWPGGVAATYWQLPGPGNLGRGRLQNPNGPVQSIFKMYPTVVNKIRSQRPAARIPTVAEFRTVLSYLSPINWEIGTWKRFDQPSIGGQGWRNHLTRILRGLIRDVPLIIAAGAAPRLNPARRVIPVPGRPGLADVNDWVKAAPDDIDWLTGFTPADPNWDGANLSMGGIWDIRWNVPSPDCRPASASNEPPLTAVDGRATITVELGGNVVYEGSTQQMRYNLELNFPPGLTGTLTIRYENINGLASELTTVVSS